MSIRIPAILTLTFASAFVTQTADAQEFLRWKFQRGEEVKYNVQQNMETLTEVGDNQINQAMKQSMDMSWNVLDVSAGGDAIMHQVVKRIQMKMASGPDGEILIDTSNPEPSENPFVKSMVGVFSNIVNQNFTVHMKPTGEVGKVEVPKELLEALRTSAAGNAAALNEKTLEDMMKKSGVTLPATQIAPNSTWTSEQSVQFPFGTINIKSTMTYVSKDTTGNAIISIQPEVSVTPTEGAPVKMTVSDSSGQGQVTFDIEGGRVTKSQLDLTMSMKIDSGQGVFNQTIKQQTALTLIE